MLEERAMYVCRRGGSNFCTYPGNTTAIAHRGSKPKVLRSLFCAGSSCSDILECNAVAYPPDGKKIRCLVEGQQGILNSTSPACLTYRRTCTPYQGSGARRRPPFGRDGQQSQSHLQPLLHRLASLDKGDDKKPLHGSLWKAVGDQSHLVLPVMGVDVGPSRLDQAFQTTLIRHMYEVSQVDVGCWML